MDKAQFESFDDMAEHTAASLVQAAAGSAFQLFRNKQFRRLAAFKKLNQTEQDRIFNELVVAFLVLTMLLLEAPDLRAEADFQAYLADLGKKIPKAHIDYLKAAGIESEHLRDWETLISMRYEEYAKDRHSVRAAAMEIDSSEKRLELDDLAKIQMLVPVQAVAIGCHHHNCRGDVDGRDDLFIATLNSLARYYIELRARLEGYKITPFKRMQVTAKRMLRRLYKKSKN